MTLVGSRKALLPSGVCVATSLTGLSAPCLSLLQAPCASPVWVEPSRFQAPYFLLKPQLLTVPLWPSPVGLDIRHSEFAFSVLSGALLHGSDLCESWWPSSRGVFGAGFTGI